MEPAITSPIFLMSCPMGCFSKQFWDPETQSKRVWVLGKFLVGWKELVDLVGGLVDLPLWKMMELK